MAWAAMLLLGTASTYSIAQIVAAPGSGAQVIETRNGLPQVNIATPSAAGVSVGTFSQFDVQRQGAILNNSATITQTQQAGFINGNANLTPGNEARIIVNQVMSNSPSQLRGALEVAGPRAEVIIANPNGLVVDGGGFINTSRAVLTTGTPSFGPSGNLAGFNVTGGNITVQGAGLNATNVDQVDILARAIQVNAAIYANNLNVIAGSNRLDHDTLTASGNATVRAQSIDNHTGSMTAGRALNVATPGALNNAGGTLSGSTTTVSGASIDNTIGSIDGDTLSVSTPGNLNNRGGKLTQYGAADQTIDVGDKLDNSGGTIATNATNLNVEAQDITNDKGKIQHAGSGTLAVIANGALSNVGGNVQTNGALIAAGTSIDNTSGTLLAMRSARVNGATGIVNRDGSFYGGNGLNVDVQGDFDNANGSAQTAGDLSINAGGALNNAQGTIAANGAHGTMAVTAARVDNTSGKLNNAGDGAMNINSSNTTVNATNAMSNAGRIEGDAVTTNSATAATRSTAA
ncbi:filamentous hemagglutinin N-terminal domain-containing protein [Caballeronia hypogeia]